ncbi:hypothetical protein [Sorangium sp. So ce542]|uniref:hypothetical protein n=1 Tax=Sorangium sp. So ce542 TaxID=3133316 RepID=UPI003F60AD12
MEELLALLDRYAPGYRGRIQGVYGWRLDELEERFGRPCPGFYRSFALAMGAEGGPLLDGLHEHHPTKIAELYELAPWMPPRRFLYVFGDASPDGQHTFLDLDAPSEAGDFQVVRFPFGEQTWKTRLTRRFVSLREMLFVLAMRNVHLPTFPHRAEHLSADGPAGAPPSAEDAAVVFERLGFTRLPYPRRCLLFERQDAAILLYRRPDEPGFSIRVGMRDAAKLRSFQAIVEDSAGLTEWRGAASVDTGSAEGR